MMQMGSCVQSVRHDADGYLCAVAHHRTLCERATSRFAEARKAIVPCAECASLAARALCERAISRLLESHILRARRSQYPPDLARPPWATLHHVARPPWVTLHHVTRPPWTTLHHVACISLHFATQRATQEPDIYNIPPNVPFPITLGTHGPGTLTMTGCGTARDPRFAVGEWCVAFLGFLCTLVNSCQQ
jgi:hypothetical protein